MSAPLPDIDSVRTLGVVGPGAMGTGIAQLAATHGYRVVLVARDAERANRARSALEAQVRRRVERGALSAADADALLARIEMGAGVSALGGVPFAIEAVTEDVERKRGVLAELDRVLPANAVLASTTSTIPIAILAAATTRPERVLGMHFFNPATVVEGVELVRSRATAEATLELGRALAIRLGKQPVVAQDLPGFITTRLIHPYLNEAAWAVMNGNAPSEVDAAMVRCLRMPMGPCALMDLIGLDVVLSCLELLEREYGERFRPAPLLRELVRAGRLGRKSGEGFHRYEPAAAVARG